VAGPAVLQYASVRLGAKIPNAGPLTASPGLGPMASAAEAAAARSLWVSDHLVMVSESATPYPYSPDRRLGSPEDAPWIESLTACAWLAAHTSTVDVGPAVMVLPQRDHAPHAESSRGMGSTSARPDGPGDAVRERSSPAGRRRCSSSTRS
jgi:hypothetical protein